MNWIRSQPPIFESRCSNRIMSTDELLAEALRLTRVDRARVAEELLSSLEESDEEVATAWATELERRSRETGSRARTLERRSRSFTEITGRRLLGRERFSPASPE